MFDKFSDPALKVQLLATGENTLVEASPYVAIWGIDLGEKDSRAENPEEWLGLNLLGQVLMCVRSRLA